MRSSVDDNIVIAGAACEIHPAAILKALEARSVRAELERATAEALALGVSDVPAVLIGDQVLIGEGQLEQAGAVRVSPGSRISSAAGAA